MAFSIKATFLNKPLATLCPHPSKPGWWFCFCLESATVSTYSDGLLTTQSRIYCCLPGDPMAPCSQGPYSFTTVKSLRGVCLHLPQKRVNSWKQSSLLPSTEPLLHKHWISEWILISYCVDHLIGRCHKINGRGLWTIGIKNVFLWRWIGLEWALPFLTTYGHFLLVDSVTDSLNMKSDSTSAAIPSQRNDIEIPQYLPTSLNPGAIHFPVAHPINQKIDT